MVMCKQLLCNTHWKLLWKQWKENWKDSKSNAAVQFSFSGVFTHYRWVSHGQSQRQLSSFHEDRSITIIISGACLKTLIMKTERKLLGQFWHCAPNFETSTQSADYTLFLITLIIPGGVPAALGSAIFPWNRVICAELMFLILLLWFL